MGSDFNGEKEQRRKYHSAESLLRVVGVGGGETMGGFLHLHKQTGDKKRHITVQ